MPNSLSYRNCQKYLRREHGKAFRCAIPLAVSILGLMVPEVLAQSKPVGLEKSPLCTRDNALEMIKQQVDLTKTFNDPTRRITVLIRAADLFWPYEQNKARGAFTEAFELATVIEKEHDAKGPRSLVLRMQKPDQRYVVIRAVSKRDPALAKKLTGELLKQVADDSEVSAKDSFNDLLTAEKLRYSASQLIPSDINGATDLFRASLNYPASSWLITFLYRLAEVNQPAADQFYAQALTIYGDRPMREFLYLQAYPFAWRDTLNTPVFSFYQVPGNFVTNQSLQRRFVQVLLRRSQQVLEMSLDEGDTYRDPTATWTPGAVSLLRALIRLEPQVRELLPDLLAPLTQAREKILVSLSVENQKLLLQPGREASTKPDQTFDEQEESAQKLSDVNERDEAIIIAVFGSQKESLPRVLQIIEKIGDSNLRAYSLEWFYFQRATTALNDKQFEEAEKLASKVEGNELRAFLHIEIAKGLLKGSDTQTHALEVIDEAVTEAKKAGMTTFAARTLLTASTLYAKINLARSIEVLTDAVSCINHIEAPDFSSEGQALEKTPVRKGRLGQYKGEYRFRFWMPGLDPEAAFRQMAKVDFDTVLSQSGALTDKFQRAMSTLGLSNVCLDQAQPQVKEKPKKRARP